MHATIQKPIEEVLLGIDGKYDYVWAYFAEDMIEPWKSYNPNAMIGNNLFYMQPWHGYWIYMNQTATLIIDAQ